MFEASRDGSITPANQSLSSPNHQSLSQMSNQSLLPEDEPTSEFEDDYYEDDYERDCDRDYNRCASPILRTAEQCLQLQYVV